MSLLRGTDLAKRYRKRSVLDGVSIEVASGEVVGLLGPNGAGKTTCFYILVGLTSADSGNVHLNGRDITSLPIHKRARLGIGYLPQEASVFRGLSIEDNILAVLELRPGLNRSARQEKLESLLDELQISHIRKNIGYSLSGGERRRTEIARALAMDPEFILLDEPFAGIDPLAVLDIQRIVRHLIDRNIGILITDHNVRETLGICHRAYILSGGKLLAEGDPETILHDKQAREVYLGEHFRL